MPNLLVQLVQPVQQCTGATSAFSPIQWIHMNWNTDYCVQTGRQVGTTGATGAISAISAADATSATGISDSF